MKKLIKLRMEHKIEKSPIIITGAARSGTSMVGGVFNICGAFGGKMSGPNKNNQKGMFENAYIRDKVEKPYLRSIDMDEQGQDPLPDTDRLPIPSDWRETIEDVMLGEGYNGGSWFYKGAKACLIWPVWHYAFPDAKWIIVRRRTADIAESCLRTGFMHKRRTFDDWVEWVNHHENEWVKMIKAGLNVKVVWPERMIKSNYEQMYEAIEWAGLTWKPDEVIDFVEPKLWKAKQKILKVN